MNINSITNQNFGANIGGYYKRLYSGLPAKTVNAFVDDVEKVFPGDSFNLFLGEVYKNAITLKNMARIWVCKNGVIMQKDFETLGTTQEAILESYKTAIKNLSNESKVKKANWWNA